MPRGIPNKKPTAADFDVAVREIMAAKTADLPPAPMPEAPRMARVKLAKSYRPINEYAIVGHYQPELKRKDAVGREHIVQHAGFVEGPKPATIAGTGFPDKVWADTVIELPETEARAVVKAGIGALEFAD